MRNLVLGLAALATVTAPVAASAASSRQMREEARRERAEPAQRGVRAGVLECQVGGSVGFIVGSKRQVDCTFRSGRGAPQRYVGSIDRYGLDVGVTSRSVMVWQVVAPSNNVARGSLAGRYSGVSAGAAAVYGATANVLVGGNRGSFNLQPLSVEGQRGVNIAAGVASLKLSPAGRS